MAETENHLTSSSTPADKAALLERIEREWSALLTTVEDLNEEELSAPGPGGWAIKDNLAHLAAWEQFMLHHHLQGSPRHTAMGIKETEMEGLDEEGINAVLYARNRNRRAGEILQELRRSHEQVVATLQELDFARLMQPRHPDGDASLIEWVAGNTYEHHEEHRRAIKAMRGQATHPT